MTKHIPRTPNYRLKEEVVISIDKYDSRVLPSGSFVRPIDLRYVPEHVIERNKGFNKDYHVFVYCRWGVFPVPKSALVES